MRAGVAASRRGKSWRGYCISTSRVTDERAAEAETAAAAVAQLRATLDTRERERRREAEALKERAAALDTREKGLASLTAGVTQLAAAAAATPTIGAAAAVAAVPASPGGDPAPAEGAVGASYDVDRELTAVRLARRTVILFVPSLQPRSTAVVCDFERNGPSAGEDER